MYHYANDYFYAISLAMQALRDYLNRYIPISDEEFEVVKSYFTFKSIRKKQYVLQEGQTCEHFAFIIKGAMRKYYLDDKGSEHIVNLYTENWWAGDRESFVMLTPTIYHIDAWEDCDVLLISRASSLELTIRSPAFNAFLLKLDEMSNIATQKRITSSIRFTAKDRYAEFAASYPEFLQRFPQHIIASYLGVTKETLSRVRKQLAKERTLQG